MTDEDRRRAHIVVLERYRDAWTAGDVASMFGLYADDFVLHWNGANPFAGTHFGKVAAIRALSAFTQKTSRKLVGVTHVMADADRAIMVSMFSSKRQMNTFSPRLAAATANWRETVDFPVPAGPSTRQLVPRSSPPPTRASSSTMPE